MARKTLRRLSEDRFDAWPGFTDVMVALLLIFVFVVTLFTITETILSRSISKKDTELLRLHREISIRDEEIAKLEEEVARLEEMFGSQKQKTAQLEGLIATLRHQLALLLSQVSEKTAALAEKERELAEKREELRTATSEIQAQAGRLEAKQRELEDALARLAAQAEKVEKRDEELEAQRSEIADIIAMIREKAGVLKERESRISEMKLSLEEAQEQVGAKQRRLSQKEARIARLQEEIAKLNTAIAALNKKIARYADQVDRLNRLLAESRKAETREKTRAASLQKEIVDLRGKLEDLGRRLEATKAVVGKKFRLSQLVSLLDEKEEEIDRLRKLAKYRSEFLAKLEKIFADVPDIKVRGDRFVFQSEILFASGSAKINESGKAELDKFVSIYKEMVPRIPPNFDPIILVQGHTDDVPISSGRYRSNWELSAARAMEVVRYLIEKGVNPKHLSAAAYGEFHSVKAGASAAARRLNRRIEIKITTL